MLSLQNKKLSTFLPTARPFPTFDFGWGWIALLAVVILDAVWAAHSPLRLPNPWIVFGNLFFVALLRFLYYWLDELDFPRFQHVLSFLESKIPGVTILMVIEYLLLSSSVSYAASLLSYLVCALPYPLIDQQLNHIDQAIGFDWSAWFRWSGNHLGIIVLRLSYYSFLFQTILFIIWFAYFSKKERFFELFWIMFIGVLLTIIISGFLPAVGPVFAFHDMLSEFVRMQPKGQLIFQQVMSIRSGTGSHFTSYNLTGIVTFPSFHTVCALAYAYVFRRTGFLGYGIVLLNILALLSIPVIGNHYLTDMIAGGLVGLLSIAIVRIFIREEIRRSIYPGHFPLRTWPF